MALYNIPPREEQGRPEYVGDSDISSECATTDLSAASEEYETQVLDPELQSHTLLLDVQRYCINSYPYVHG